MVDQMIDELQKWYLSQCDGDWEHECGIEIETLDNPGWLVVIDLRDTIFKNKIFHEVDRQINENDWVQCELNEGKFRGAGGPKNLTDIIKIFIEWTKS